VLQHEVCLAGTAVCLDDLAHLLEGVFECFTEDAAKRASEHVGQGGFVPVDDGYAIGVVGHFAQHAGASSHFLLLKYNQLLAYDKYSTAASATATYLKNLLDLGVPHGRLLELNHIDLKNSAVVSIIATS
jgi:hypothetical protein